MSDPPTSPPASWTAARIADPVRAALESGDVGAFGALLSHDVRWGPPGSKNPPCKNREQVLNWYRQGRSAGASAQVTELTAIGEALLIGLLVARDPGHPERSDARWQVMQIGTDGIRDIRGYEDRQQAADDLPR
jgi:hypothetical protein